MSLKFVLLILKISAILSFVSSANHCGVPANGVSLIVNGNGVRRGAWPWMVALLEREDRNNKLFCGAVLIGKSKILTAAHCIQGKNQRPRKIRDIVLLLGAYDLTDRNEIGVYLTAPSDIVMHPDWNPYSMRYDADIAVILLEDEVPYSKFIRPICIGSPDIEINEGTVTGWGKSEDNSKIHENTPRELITPIWTNEDCFLEAYEFALLGSRRTFCAGGRNNSGPCNGDSGGGLFVELNGVFYLKGIVSAALEKHSHCDVTSFALYTNVDKFVEWFSKISILY